MKVNRLHTFTKYNSSIEDEDIRSNFNTAISIMQKSIVVSHQWNHKVREGRGKMRKIYTYENKTNCSNGGQWILQINSANSFRLYQQIRNCYIQVDSSSSFWSFIVNDIRNCVGIIENIIVWGWYEVIQNCYKWGWYEIIPKLLYQRMTALICSMIWIWWVNGVIIT